MKLPFRACEMFVNENLDPGGSGFFLHIYRTNKKYVMMKLVQVLSACFYIAKFICKKILFEDHR